MEASAAAQGQGDAGGEAQGGEAQGGPDFQAVVDQLGTMAQGQEEMRQALAGLPEMFGQQEQPQQEEQPQYLDPSMLDFDNPQFDPNQAAQGLMGFFESQWQAREQQLMDQHVNPLRQQVTAIQQTAEARDLVTEFPELGEAEAAQMTVRSANELAQTLGHPELGSHPQFWRLSYLANRAMESMQQEGQEQLPPGHVEGGGGAAPGGGQDDLKAQILAENKGSSVLPF